MLTRGELEDSAGSGRCKFSPGTARRLRETLNSLFFRSTKSAANDSIKSLIETDYLNGITEAERDNLRRKGLCGNSDDMPLCLPDTSYFSMIDDVIEAEQWQSIATLLTEKLRSETAKLHLDLFLPSNLFERISKDIVRMSANEPCGLRGCLLHVNLKQKGSTAATDLGAVQRDVSAVPTFELHLTLVEDDKRWYSIRDLIAPVLPGCLNESHALEVFISPGYRLVKRKLYRPN